MTAPPWNQFVRSLPDPTLTIHSEHLSAQEVMHQNQPPEMFHSTRTYSTPGRFTIMNTRCGEAVNSPYKITPFLLPVGPGCCLSNEVMSCHVTPPPSQQPTCVDFSLNPPTAPFFCAAL